VVVQEQAVVGQRAHAQPNLQRAGAHEALGGARGMRAGGRAGRQAAVWRPTTLRCNAMTWQAGSTKQRHAVPSSTVRYGNVQTCAM
jgi:hypothetical protein